MADPMGAEIVVEQDAPFSTPKRPSRVVKPTSKKRDETPDRRREKVQRFMTVTSGNAKAEPTPMDWIYEARTYGMHIRFNTPAGGTIDWVGDRIKHRRVQFRMGELTEMLHSLKDEARGLLTTLAMVDDVSQLPQIPWSSFEDDHSEDRVGYSFLEDDRNHTWLEAGKNWGIRRITDSPGRRKIWFDHGREDGKPFQARAVQSYGQTLVVGIFVLEVADLVVGPKLCSQSEFSGQDVAVLGYVGPSLSQS
ncbi:uncharacterized protein FOBCDRAFT_203957 [Fusarium oxysporum Fo47]|uniref:uncharacterized protein n=1 Tax=Fusarium oxysporum Fo47 TaxID=660027 RepID=UPI002869B29D|nr:uncharacterized protein FOBCDRAFT_203957 [Fusarium oxysporum Fo47]WJG35681.1 hypothetical protein FOBCDRAFT_203957 [Fusarium oxysporum Fo47]